MKFTLFAATMLVFMTNAIDLRQGEFILDFLADYGSLVVPYSEHTKQLIATNEARD